MAIATATAQPRARREESGALTFYLIATSAGLLLILGVVMVLSATSIISIRDNDGNPFAEFMDQAKFVMIGLPILVVAAMVPVRVYKRLAYWAFAATLGLQALILTPLAVGKNGNVNWIVIPGLNQSIQPSEFLKLGLALALGYYLATHIDQIRSLRAMWSAFAMAAAALAFVLYGHDMGTAIVFVILIVSAFWVAGMPLTWFAVLTVAGAGGTALLVAISPSRIRRIMQFFGLGEADPTGAGFQSEHGLWGLGTGGLFGVGLGASREKWAYLPEAHNDFIFAILGEELGLVGTLVVLALFGVLAYALLRLISRHPDPFVKITTAAIMGWLIGQALANIGVVIGVLPVIGIPLPLLSAGGSAMVSSLAAFGVLLAFARSEPGASAALATTTRAVRRSLAVVGGGLRRRGG